MEKRGRGYTKKRAGNWGLELRRGERSIVEVAALAELLYISGQPKHRGKQYTSFVGREKLVRTFSSSRPPMESNVARKPDGSTMCSAMTRSCLQTREREERSTPRRACQRITPTLGRGVCTILGSVARHTLGLQQLNRTPSGGAGFNLRTRSGRGASAALPSRLARRHRL